MRKYFSLTRTLFKNAAGMVADGKTKKMRVYLLYGFLAICFKKLLKRWLPCNKAAVF